MLYVLQHLLWHYVVRWAALVAENCPRKEQTLPRPYYFTLAKVCPTANFEKLAYKRLSCCLFFF